MQKQTSETWSGAYVRTNNQNDEIIQLHRVVHIEGQSLFELRTTNNPNKHLVAVHTVFPQFARQQIFQWYAAKRNSAENLAKHLNEVTTQEKTQEPIAKSSSDFEDTLPIAMAQEIDNYIAIITLSRGIP